ncbi:MAG: hypothetical protein K6E27_13705 [Eubacterium sp.]|nr:hypothetical protein [Eubacterium sp.]
MLKIRLQGTTNDLKWFIKMLSRDKRFVINTPSDPQDIKGSKKYKRVYTEVFRTKEEFQRYNDSSEPEIVKYYYGSGTTYGYGYPKRKKK